MLRKTTIRVLIGSSWFAVAQDPLKTLPANYRTIFENTQVAVIRAHYGPHEKVPVHDHPGVATVFVYLNDGGAVRIDHQDAGGAPESVVRPPTKLGAYRVAPALAERHSLENLGDVSSEFLRVEMKGATLGIKEPFRGKALAGPLKDEDVVEFSDPAVRVERIVCVDAAPCGVKAEDAGGLMVALGPVAGFIVVPSGGNINESEPGSVWWLPAGKTSVVTGKAGGLELLRIVLPEPTKQAWTLRGHLRRDETAHPRRWVVVDKHTDSLRE